MSATLPLPMASSSSQSHLNVWNVIGNKCYICYSNYENGVSDQSSDYRQQVMESCADALFSEITGDEFDWNLMVYNESMPFCQSCWQTIEKIYDLNQHKDSTENSIEDIVKDLARKVLSNRRYLKKKGVLSSSKTNPIPASFGDGIKIEGFSVNQTKCKMCHNVYMIGNSSNLLSLDISGKVMECCEQHVFPELFDDEFFDWNSIPFNNFVPFCEECSQDIKNIMDLHEKLKEIESFVSSNVDMFTLNVLKTRRSLKKMLRRSKNGFRDDASIASVDSQDSQDTIDLDDECQIINVSTAEVYPNNFAETSLQEPPGQFMEQPVHSEIPSTSNGYRPEIQIEETVPVVAESSMNSSYSYSYENNITLTRPNSAETCVVPPQVSMSNFQNIPNMERERPELSAVLRLPNKSENILVNNLPYISPSVTIARLSQKSGTLFKCQTPNCGKIFIFRKCWEAHAAECPKTTGTGGSAPVLKTCCGQSFTDDDSWDIHRVSHRSQSFTRSQSNKSLSSPVRSRRERSLSQSQSSHLRSRSHSQSSQSRRSRSRAASQSPSFSHEIPRDRRSQSQTPADDYYSIPLEYQCNYCEKRCQTGRGLKLHIRSHTKQDTFKCRKCPRSFGYPSQLKKHYNACHSENSTIKSRSPPKPKTNKATVVTTTTNSSTQAVPKKRINFSCRFCTTPIFNKRDLIDHVQSHYTVASGFRCEICKMVFSQKSSVKTHNKSFHKHLC